MRPLRRFFPYYGSKIQLVSRGIYPGPRYETVIEPFAGSAGYSLNYFWKNVILNDKDETIYMLWRYLINVSEKEILSLPVDGFGGGEAALAQEARWLINFWNNPGSAQPNVFAKSAFATKRPDTSWCATVRNRIANQLRYIRHWEIRNEEYYAFSDNLGANDINPQRATWFVDPPYQRTGGAYKERFIIYEALAEWCKRLKGQVIVCEEGTAHWLPFREVSKNVTQSKKLSSELIWTADTD